MEMATLKPAEKWTAIIEAARRNPGGVKAYCDANEIRLHSYYAWFKRLKSAHPEWSKTIPRRATVVERKKVRPAEFVSVKVVPDVPKTSSNFAVEIHLSRGPVVVLPHGMSAQQLAEFVLEMESKTC